MGNLVRDGSELIGRDDVLAELDTLLAPGQLVTLIGAGGIGKTRLARELGLRRGAAWFCDLTEAHSAPDVINAVARALEVPLPAAATRDALVDQLGRAMAGRNAALLILDNAEQVAADAAPLVARWRALCPDAAVLVTSRQPLHIDGERRLDLAPLSIDDGVALFRARAAAVRRGVDVDADAGAIASIVARLDGLPLALELAAARVGVLTPGDLLARLDHRFELLRTDRTDAPARHATLWNAVQWSWDTLDPVLQDGLRQCAVFAGGFTLDAAEHVLDAPNVLNVVESLRDRSLVRSYTTADGSLRFGLLESIREFARRQLDGWDGAAGAHARHAAYYLERRFERAELAAECDNLVAIARRGGAESVRAVLALQIWFEDCGPAEVYRELLAAARRETAGDRLLSARLACASAAVGRGTGATSNLLADIDAAVDTARAHGAGDVEAEALARRGYLLRENGDLDAARACYDDALAILHELDDRVQEGRIMIHIGAVEHMCGRSDEACAWFERAARMLSDAGDRRSEAVAIVNLALMHCQLDHIDLARDFNEQAIELHRALRNRLGEGVAHGTFGDLSLREGRHDDALACYAEALACYRAIGNRRWEGIAVTDVAHVYLDRGDWADARRHASRALAIHRECRNRYFEAIAQRTLGAAYLGAGAIDRATAELTAAADIHDDMGSAEAAATRLYLTAADALRGDTAAADELAAHVRDNAHNVDARIAQRLVATELHVDRDSRWFQLSGHERVELSRRRALRLVMDRLAGQRCGRPGTGLAVDALLQAGWPGERVSPESGAQRVHQAVAALRRMGLRGILLNRDDGYLLDPNVPIQRV